MTLTKYKLRANIEATKSKHMKLNKARRNEIAYKLHLVNMANNGMQFTPMGKQEKLLMKKLGIEKAELIAFATQTATTLATESFKKKWSK